MMVLILNGFAANDYREPGFMTGKADAGQTHHRSSHPILPISKCKSTCNNNL